MDRLELIKEFEEERIKLIKEKSNIKKENPYMHWSEDNFKKCQELEKNINILVGKIECLEENKDTEEINNLLLTKNWSWESE